MFIFSVSLAGYCIVLLLRHRYAHEVPIAVEMAADHFRMPWFLRPLMAAWWMGHFLIGAAGGLAITVAGETATGELPHQVHMLLIALICTFGITYAANIYLALAMMALTNRLRWVERLWRVRIVIDFAIAIAALVIASMIPPQGK